MPIIIGFVIVREMAHGESWKTKLHNHHFLCWESQCLIVESCSLPTFAASNNVNPPILLVKDSESHVSSIFIPIVWCKSHFFCWKSPCFCGEPAGHHRVPGAAARWAPATASRRAGRPGRSACRAPRWRWYLEESRDERSVGIWNDGDTTW